MQRTFLVTSLSDPGHLFAVLPVVQGLAARGHRVRVYGPPSIRPLIDACGGELVATETFDAINLFARVREARAERERRRPLLRWLPGAIAQRLDRARGVLGFRSLIERLAADTADVLVDVIAQERPAALVADSNLFGARYAAERSRIPFITLATDPTLGLTARGIPALPPDPRMSYLPAAGWNAVVDAALPIGRLRARWQLPPQHRTAELYDLLVSERLHLVPAPREMMRHEPAVGHLYVGPMSFDPPTPCGDGATPAMPEGALLLAWTTIPRPDAKALLRRTAVAVAATGRALVITGGGADLEARSLGSHTRVVRGFAPHKTMVPAARALICHAGWGTVSRGLRAGVPMLLIPAFGPQPMVAERLAELGLARHLPADRVDASSVAHELDALLGDEGLRRRLRAFRDRLAASDPVGSAVDAIETAVGAPGGINRA